MIELYAPPLVDPVLKLFPTQIGLLRTVGVDPEDLGPEPYYASFYALYRLSERKRNRAGQPYKDVIELVPNTATATDRVADLLEELLEEVKDIRDYLYDGVNPVRSQSQAAALLPASLDAALEPGSDLDPREVKRQLVAILGPHLYLHCRQAAELQQTADTGAPDWATFQLAVQDKIVPRRITTEQLMDTCAIIDEEWDPGKSWWPMILGLAFYVKRTVQGGDPDKDNAILCATGIYLSVPPSEEGENS